jgi:hypothetical protein
MRCNDSAQLEALAALSPTKPEKPHIVYVAPYAAKHDGTRYQQVSWICKLAWLAANDMT